MELHLVLSAFFASFGLTLAHPESLMRVKAVASGGKGEIRIGENLHNLFDSITKNDMKKTEAYRGLLGEQAFKEQEAFNAMRDELQSARKRNIVGSSRMYKREAPVTTAEAAPTYAAKQTSKTGLKHLSLSISNAAELIQGGYVYVDKTAFVMKLLKSPDKYFLLARPRHFGKTTFLSTIKEIFENGNKTLFKGTAIYDSDFTWPTHPVISIGMTDGFQVYSAEEVEKSLIEAVRKVALSYEITSLEGLTLKETIQNLISMLHQKFSKQVMILIDGYDFPYTEVHEQIEVAEKNVEVLRTFFSAIHAMDKDIRFCMVAGVVQVASCNLEGWTDITTEEAYATIAGFTQEELEREFTGHIDNVVRARPNMTREDVLAELHNWYEGHRFSASKRGVYNPWSVISYFISKKTDRTWPQWMSNKFMGLKRKVLRHPDTIIDYLHRRKFYPKKYFDNLDVDRLWGEGLSDLETLLLMTGCLTVKKYDPKRDALKLGYANREVHEAMYEQLIRGFGKKKQDDLRQIVSGLKSDLDNFYLDAFLRKANLYTATFLANATEPDDHMSPHLPSHKVTNGILHVIFRTMLMVAEMEIDDQTSLDDKLETIFGYVAGKLHLFELRLDIDVLHNCIKKFKGNFKGERGVCVGVKFDTKTARIIDVDAAELSEEGEELRTAHSDINLLD